VLNALHRGENRRNLILAALANLASYLLLIVPSYLYPHDAERVTRSPIAHPKG